jgi:hypothetical protein
VRWQPGIHFFGHPSGGFGFRNAVSAAFFQSPFIFNRSGSGPLAVLLDAAESVPERVMLSFFLSIIA